MVHLLAFVPAVGRRFGRDVAHVPSAPGTCWISAVTTESQNATSRSHTSSNVESKGMTTRAHPKGLRRNPTWNHEACTKSSRGDLLMP